MEKYIEEKPGWIYFLRGPDNLFKIGKSKKYPTKRIAEYSPLLPFETEIAFGWQAFNIDQAEILTHKALAAYRLRGEWFRLPDEVIAEIEYGVFWCKDDIKPKELRGVNQ